MRRFVFAIVALIAFAPAVPASSQSRYPVPRIEEVPAPIVRLLTDYSRAWRDKDSSLLAATVAPGLREREELALRNARDVAFTRFDVVATTQFSGNLASRRVHALYSSPDVATYNVVERSRIGPETSSYEEDGGYTFVRGKARNAYDGWQLAAKDDLDVLGFFSPHHLWDEKKVAVLSGRRFVLLTHPEVADEMPPILHILEEAYNSVQKFWPRPLHGRFIVVVPSTTGELGRVIHETVALDKFVAFVASTADRSRGWAPTGPRVFIHLDHLRNYAPAAQLEILAHELVHAVTRDVSGPEVPTWVEEGLANFGGGNGGRPFVAAEHPAPDDFPTTDRFTAGTVTEIERAYDQAQVAIAALDDKFGRERLVRFYESLGAERVTLGTEEYWIARDVRRILGWTHDKWVAAWHERLAR